MAASALAHTSDSPPAIDRSIVLVGMMGAGKTVDRTPPREDAGLAVQGRRCRDRGRRRHHHRQHLRRDRRARVPRQGAPGHRPPAAAASAWSWRSAAARSWIPQTRALVREKARSIWLRAELDVLVRRTARPGKRPLLAKGDPRAVLAAAARAADADLRQADLIDRQRQGADRRGGRRGAGGARPPSRSGPRRDRRGAADGRARRAQLRDRGRAGPAAARRRGAARACCAGPR